MNERTLWLAVLQTFLAEASRIKHSRDADNKWDSLWREANFPSTKGICEVVDVNHQFFLTRLVRAYRTGTYVEAEL